MANLSIQKIGQKIFTPKNTIAKSSNPFAASTFKGNVLTADVFETKAKATKKNKLTYSAFVGSIGDAFPTFRKAVESVVAFGNRMKEGINTTFHKISDIGNMEVSVNFAGIGDSIKSSFTSMVDKYSVQRLKKYDVASLEKMWKDMSGINVAV